MSCPLRMRSSENFIASTGARMRISSPEVSCSFRYFSTLAITCASCARLASSQNTAGVLVRRARRTPSSTQFRIGASLTWHIRKMSPVSTGRCQQHRAVVGDNADRAVGGNFERLVVRAVFLGLLRHQPHVRNRAHRLGVERAVRLTVLDDRLIQPRVAAIRDHGIDVVQLAVGAPHAAGLRGSSPASKRRRSHRLTRAGW